MERFVFADVEDVAVVTEDGRIRLEDAVYASLTAAAAAVNDGPANGWTFWVVDTVDGQRSLAQLRDDYLAEERA